MNWWVVRRKIHASWLIALLGFGIVVGVVLAKYTTGGMFFGYSWLMIGLAMVAFSLWRRRIWVVLPILVAGLIIGLWRGSIDQRLLTPWRNLLGVSTSVTGSVTDDPDIERVGQLVLRLDDLSVKDHPINGRIWVSLATDVEVKRGDIVTIDGTLSPGFGNFSAAIYRAQLTHIVRPQPGDLAGRVRDWFADNVRLAIPEPQASLGLGYLVGQRRALPVELVEALKIAGLTHVVVASGYNLTILVRLARRLFVKISKYLAALSATVMIVAFIAITGLSPSMSRAGLVAGLSLVAWYYGRRFHPLVLLPFAAAITLLINPSYGWNDIGWQLSFAAFAGVMILAPLLQSYFFADRKLGMLGQVLIETIAATVATLPIIIMTFGVFSNVVLISNLLILPLVPLAMLLTFVAGVMAVGAPSLAAVFGMPATWLLGYMVNVTRYLASLSWAQTSMSIGMPIFVIMYAFIVAGCIYMWHRTKYKLGSHSLAE